MYALYGLYKYIYKREYTEHAYPPSSTEKWTSRNVMLKPKSYLLKRISMMTLCYSAFRCRYMYMRAYVYNASIILLLESEVPFWLPSTDTSVTKESCQSNFIDSARLEPMQKLLFLSFHLDLHTSKDLLILDFAKFCVNNFLSVFPYSIHMQIRYFYEHIVNVLSELCLII